MTTMLIMDGVGDELGVPYLGGAWFFFGRARIAYELERWRELYGMRDGGGCDPAGHDFGDEDREARVAK